QPSWEPLYLAHPGAASLPRIGYALLRAYLPTLSAKDVRQLLTGTSAAGLSSSPSSHDNVATPGNRPRLPEPSVGSLPVGRPPAQLIETVPAGMPARPHSPGEPV